jgi:hypothetical protein
MKMIRIKNNKNVFLTLATVLLFLTTTVILTSAAPLIEKEEKINISDIPGIPPFLEKGDILLLDLPGNWVWNLIKSLLKGNPFYDAPPNRVCNDHSALYMGRNFKPTSINDCSPIDWNYYKDVKGVWFISALGASRENRYNVHYNTIDYFIDVPNYDDLITNRSWEFRYGHVLDDNGQDANSTIKNNAVQWADSKLGDEYQNIYDDPIKEAEYDPTSQTSYKWFCMELIWAAYYNQGIDIDYWDFLQKPPTVYGFDIILEDILNRNYERYDWP